MTHRRAIRSASGAFALILSACFAASTFAAGSVTVLPVWPDGPPDDNGLKGPERGGGCVGNISKATMTVYLPDKDKANKELVKFFSKLLKKKVEIIRGARGREKVLLIR